jgi:asparagine synthase (glutamine-hydrolysing)
MCGIAGIVDLSGQQRPLPPGLLQRMADSLVHRGPDEDGYLEAPGLGLASRRLSIVGLFDGRQPITNEEGNVAVVYNGELFDYVEQRAALEARGHRFRTHSDTEVIPHRWEEHGEDMFTHLRGQFAFALWDSRTRRLILARDRFGICPLYWTVQREDGGDWLLFASEVRALLASGLVTPQLDPRGLAQLFTFFAVPGPRTCFADVRILPPGRFLDLSLPPNAPAQVRERTYWQMDFPDRGDEDHRSSKQALCEEFNHVLRQATERRLRADVPVVSYLSGGVDSSTVVALASALRETPIPTFTIGIQSPELNEISEAGEVAKFLGSRMTVVNVGSAEIWQNYPELIQAAEAPVIDTSCAALLLLAREVNRQGFKVALTGEGADEWLAGYPWHKVHRLFSCLDVIPGLRVSQWLRRAIVRLNGQDSRYWQRTLRTQAIVGGHNGWLDMYGLMSMSRIRFFHPDLLKELIDYNPYEELALNHERLNHWHPLNRELHLGGRVHLPGLLLASKGDRVAMHSSVETRYPFLDEEVFDFLTRVPPGLKLQKLRDKALLRDAARHMLPKAVADRRKALFRAPLDSFRLEQTGKGVNPELNGRPDYVEQLLSEESLRRTGYFDPAGVKRWRQALSQRFLGLRSVAGLRRTSVEMGLVGVLATQLWHHTFIDSLADLPSHADRRQLVAASAGR